MTGPASPTASTAQKVAMVFLTLSILALVGIAVASGLHGELLGGIAFGLVAASVLLIPVLVLSKWTPNIQTFAKVVWFAYCIASLLLIALAASQAGTKDLDIVVAVLAAILAFPVGIIVAVAGSMLYGVIPSFAASASVLVIAIALGYWQWFVLWPKLGGFRGLGSSSK